MGWMMKTGDKVKIYDDPMTKQSLEGEAYLKEFVFRTGKESEIWNVEFLRKDGSREHACQRTIFTN